SLRHLPSGWTIFTLLSTVENPDNNYHNNGNNHITDFTENLLHQMLVFAKIKSDTRQKCGPDDGSKYDIKHKYPERHMTHASSKADKRATRRNHATKEHNPVTIMLKPTQ